ncbi:MAG: cysteine hydrolase family protein [Mycobacteriales bacterium]
MTTLTERPNTALLVVDVQNDVVASAHNRDGVIANIAFLVAKARAEKVPVVWVQHSADDLPEGSDGWRYVPELTQEESEPVVHKRYGDSFENTDLEAVLAERQVGHLIVTGAQTDACIRSTLHGAIVRGYDATLVSDAHTAPGRQAGTVSTGSVNFDRARTSALPALRGSCSVGPTPAMCSTRW